MNNISGASRPLTYTEYLLASGMDMPITEAEAIAEADNGKSFEVSNTLERTSGLTTGVLTLAMLTAVLGTSGTQAGMSPDPPIEMVEPSGIIVTSANPISQSIDNLRRKFVTLSSKWREETAMLSSTSKIVMHPSYQSIMAMGEKAIPFILEELKQDPTHWFYALRLITDESPVNPEDLGDMEKMAQAWIEWGVEHGYAI